MGEDVTSAGRVGLGDAVVDPLAHTGIRGAAIALA